MVELLVVVAILVVLFGLVSTAFIFAKRRATVADSMSNLRQVAAALVLYREQNEDWPRDRLDHIALGQESSFRALLRSKLDPFKPAYLQWYDDCMDNQAGQSEIPTSFHHPFRRFPGKAGGFSLYEAMSARYERPAILADRTIGTFLSEPVERGVCDGAWDGPYHRVADDTSVRRMNTVYRREASAVGVDLQSFFIDLPVSDYGRLVEP